MKPTTLFRTLLLALLMAAGGNSAMAQSDSCAVNVIHTYMNGRPIQWDSVKVKVQDAPYHYHTFMMYWPDTILANCATGIEEYAPAKETELSQVFPNPCIGTSQVKLTTRNSETVSVRVMDMQGRICCQKNLNLPTGDHLLSLTLPQSGLFFVQAETGYGSESCKVLCTEGQGSDFNICLISNSLQPIEKDEKSSKGGEGQFNRTDKMQITAYITYNGSVLTSVKTVNHNYTLEGYEFSVWMYDYGSINIFMNTDRDTNITFAGNTYKLIVSSQICLPFIEVPIGYTINFSDSMFYSEPEAFSAYASSTWQFDGWYKYRYYPELGNAFEICNVDEILPDQPYAYSRYIFVTSNRDAIIYRGHPYLGGTGYEWLVLDE